MAEKVRLFHIGSPSVRTPTLVSDLVMRDEISSFIRQCQLIETRKGSTTDNVPHITDFNVLLGQLARTREDAEIDVDLSEKQKCVLRPVLDAIEDVLKVDAGVLDPAIARTCHMVIQGAVGRSTRMTYVLTKVISICKEILGPYSICTCSEQVSACLMLPDAVTYGRLFMSNGSSKPDLDSSLPRGDSNYYPRTCNNRMSLMRGFIHFDISDGVEEMLISSTILSTLFNDKVCD